VLKDDADQLQNYGKPGPVTQGRRVLIDAQVSTGTANILISDLLFCQFSFDEQISAL